MVSLELNKYSPWGRSEESGRYFYLSLSLCLSPLSQISSAEFTHRSFMILSIPSKGQKQYKSETQSQLPLQCSHRLPLLYLSLLRKRLRVLPYFFVEGRWDCHHSILFLNTYCVLSTILVNLYKLSHVILTKLYK